MSKNTRTEWCASLDYGEAPPKEQPPVAVQRSVVPLGIRAARRRAKLLAAVKLEHLICDGLFPDEVKPIIWSIIDRLRAQSGKRPNAPHELPATKTL